MRQSKVIHSRQAFDHIARSGLRSSCTGAATYRALMRRKKESELTTVF
ncbi:MAG: hypothetical protein VZR37_05525 [Bifidobacterium merycicum]|nr:hypothetical protein [Bifidobacterium merycicum]MBQ1512853.1 hypothetical protein [Bifidobacterium sp.]MEE3342139.1 hypothetical protein [Bifidobacterium merycicum]SHE53390.1 hypothetical protein SAMN02745589_1053 [Bifidobacterium merycicum DSM 6492]